MKNNTIKCNGCKFNAINNPYCEYCNDFDKFIPRQVIRYGYELKFDSVIVPEIKSVIFNKPATIVLWIDGTKTVVKAKKEKFDPEKGLSMAIAKKAYGNKGNYFNRIKKWVGRYDSETGTTVNDLKAVCELGDLLNKERETFGKKLNRMISEIEFLLNHAPTEDECTDEENRMFSDMANLKNSIETVIEEL